MKLSTRLLLSTTCLTAAFISAGPMAYANPVGGTVSGGKAVISSSGDTLTVQQKTSRAVIDWRGFDIGRNETTQFVQPSAKSIILNRVNSDHASDIEGRLSANGNVIVVNQNGVLFGPHSQINVNGLIATTADISNKNFMAGKLMFNKPGDPNAAIINAGTITANQAGLVGFVASNVINNGIITAKLGRIQLASGDTATVDLYGDKLMEVAVSDQVKSQLVANNGAVIADGGTVAMTAAAGAKIVNSLITNGGSLRALSVGMKNGEIIIGAEGANAVTGNRAANKGKKQGSSMALVGGTLDASGYAAGQQGGHIIITADKIGVMGGAILDASGDTGGGMIKVGGDFHGAGATATALNTYVDQNAYIFADANTSGRGGTVAIWSDGVTSFAGNIFARGGALSGDGGFVETSGHAMLDASGYVDLTAPNGEKGTYLLDPTDITVYGNFAPNYGTVIQGDTTTLASLLTLWLDSSDTANVNLTYNSMGATATGTGGTNTLTVSNAAGLTVGARIRLGASGSVTAASTVGVDTYTIQAISGTTVTLTTNLAATYTASAVYQGYISQLTDKSGNNYNATQATASDMPLWISNGQNGAGVTSFNGTNNFLILPNLDSTSLSTFVSFQEDTAPGGGFATIYGADGSGGFGVGIYPGTNVQDFTRTAIGDVRGNQSLTYPGTYLIQQSFDGNTVHFYLNGTSDGNPAYAVPINSGGAAYKIGGLPGLGGYYNKFNTDDIILYNNANQFIGTNSQALINQYQATKWNIALTGPGVIGSESGLTGAEAQSAMASTHAGATTDGFSTFTTTYLNHLSQTSNIILDASHNITLDLQGDTLAIASGKNLTLNAGNEIISVSAGTITTSQSGGVGGNITFNAANDIALNNSFTINSNGGAITFSSETNPVDYKGINLASGTVINSGGGNISLLGITTLAGTLNAGAGDIAITNTRLGHGNSGAIVVNSGANVAGHDILLYTSTGQYGGQIRLNSGAQLNATHSMTLQADDTLSTADGYNSASGYAGVVLNAGASIISPTLTVQTAGSPLDYNGAALTISGSTLFKVTGIGSPISLNANLSIGDLTLIDNYGLSGTGAITSTGAVTINSYTNNVDMGLGVNAGEMQISSALLNAISATSLTIGRSDNSGAVWLGSFNPQENLNILNGSGEIALNGATIIGAGTLSIVNTGALALLNSTLQGSALTVSGAVTDLAGTSLNATGSLNVNGSTSTSLLGNSFTTAGNAATVTGGTINLAGTQTFATAGGAISLTGPVTLFGDTVLDAGNNALTVNGAINSAPAFNGMIEGLLVGGGGGGGGYLGGGGGGGGVVAFNQAFNNFYITNVVIGAGGLGGYGSSGGHSENSTAFGAIAAGGGGGGHYADTNGLTGGSGGGAGASGGATPSGGASSGNSLGAGNSADATYIVAGANGSGLYGNAGGNITGGRGGNATTSSGGGGGAGAAGGDVASNGAGADGGIGLQSTINGASLYYAGGGGGSGYSANGGNGGLGGGGGASGNSIGSGGTGGLNAGGTSFGYGNHHGGDAGANTGGGGGGGAENNANWGGSGGSGVLVVRYATADAAGVLTTGASLTTSGADTIATFTGSGSFVAGGCTTGCGLTINAGTLHLNGALGDMASLGAVSLISANSLALPSITATHILARTTNANADLSISAGKTVTASNAGSAITLVAGRNFINNAGSGALSASNGRWLIYSANPTSTTGEENLASNFNRYHCTYLAGCDAGVSIPGSGNGLIYSYQPTLTVTPSALNVAYGDTPNLSAYGYTVTNYNAGDSGGVTGTLSGTTNYAAGDNAGGIYYIDYASGALASAQGYNFTYANNASAITVVKEDITAAFINSLSKIYGTANPSIDYTNFTFSTLYGSDGSSLFSSITPNFGGVNGTTSVGSAYAISASIADTMNYHVINTPGTTLAITARTVTIDPTAGQSKIYGTSDPVLTYGTAAATGTTGLVNGDNLSGNLSYNNAGQYTNVGTYATTLGTLSNSNYNIVLENNAPTFGITRRSVTINPTAGQSKIYGMVDPNLAYTTDVATGTNGLVNNDTLNGNISYQGAGHYTGVGNYATTLGNLSNSNYNIVLGSSTPTFGITQRSVTVDPTAGQSKIYGAADPVIAYNTDPVTGTTGLVNGDTLSGRLSYVGAGQYTNVGSYAMTLGNVSNGNYNIALQVAAPTYAITKRDVTATLANKNLNSGAIFSVLDQNNPADVAWSGLVGSDTPVNLDSVTFSYGGAMPGMVNPTGSYNLGIASFADNNYNLSSFTSGLLTIGALPPVMAQPQLPSTVLRIGINAGLSQGGVMSFNNFGNQIVMQIDGEYTSGSMATINDEDPLLLDSSANDSQSVTNNFYSNQIIFVSIDPKLVAQLNLLNK